MLTGQERRVANLIPNRGGEVRNPTGSSQRAKFAKVVRALSKDGEGREWAELLHAIARADLERLQPVLSAEIKAQLSDADPLLLLKLCTPSVSERLQAIAQLIDRGIGKAAEIPEEKPVPGNPLDQLLQVLDAVPEDMRRAARAHLSGQNVTTQQGGEH